MNQRMYMWSIFLKTPLLTNFDFSQNFFTKIWVAKLVVQLICEHGLSAGVYSMYIIYGDIYQVRIKTAGLRKIKVLRFNFPKNYLGKF